MPNAFAYFALFAYPLVAVLTLRGRPLVMSIPIAIFGAYLLLPMRTEIDLPALPPYDKNLAGVVSALLLVAVAASRHPGSEVTRPAQKLKRGWIPKASWARLCLFGIFAGAFMTAITNGEPLTYGPTFLPGMTLYDAFSDILSAIMMLLPLALGRRYLASPEAQRNLLLVYAVSAGLYTLPALFEMRMAPQLHTWIYGFFQHNFGQHMRGSGYRPIVFLEHGLFVGLYFSLACLAALSCARERHGADKIRFLVFAAYLLGVLVVTTNLGALILALCFAPLILFMPQRAQLLIAALVVSITVAYPVLRGAHLFPIDAISAWANAFSAERGQSLDFRFEHEEMLLDRASLKAVFGWGGWNRNAIYDELGRPVSVTDGTWIILIGMGGWVRFLSVFALLAMPVVILALTSSARRSGYATTGLALLTAANMVDLIPNSSLTPLTWLVAGSLLGYLEQPAGREDASSNLSIGEVESLPPPRSIYEPTFRRTSASPMESSRTNDELSPKYEPERYNTGSSL